MGELLNLDGVEKSFGGVAAVRGISLSVSEGETVGLMGPNGAGKTTLFNLIAGSLEADRGEMSFDGVDLRGLPPHRRAALGISRTFQTARPLTRMTVAENVIAGAVFGRGRVRRSAAGGVALELLDLVSLLDKADVSSGSLSLAEERRLELARALATMPRLLMVDEVMAGLTQGERASMVGLLGTAARERGLTLIVSEHVTGVLASLCKRLVVVDRGMKLADGETESVLRSDLVAEAYFGRRSPAAREDEAMVSTGVGG